MKRRRFLQCIEGAAAGVLSAGMAASLAACSTVRYVTSTRDGGRLVVARADLAEAPYVLVSHADLPRPIFLQALPDGSFSAVSTRCMHRGCQVEPAGDRLVCPCHGSQYRLTGEVLRGPTERSLDRYDVRADADVLYILLETSP